MNVFELTVPLEPNISMANTRKTNKYAHLISDSTDCQTNIIPFEIGSRGYISPENKTRLKNLHKFCTSEVSLATFMKNISTIAVNSSYYIFLNRKQPCWDRNTPIISPLF